MATIYIRRDRLRATAKVWLENYPATPTWTSRYTGTVWKPNNFQGRTVYARAKFPDNFLESLKRDPTHKGSTIELEKVRKDLKTFKPRK